MLLQVGWQAWLGDCFTLGNLAGLNYLPWVGLGSAPSLFLFGLGLDCWSCLEILCDDDKSTRRCPVKSPTTLRPPHWRKTWRDPAEPAGCPHCCTRHVSGRTVLEVGSLAPPTLALERQVAVHLSPFQIPDTQNYEQIKMVISSYYISE